MMTGEHILNISKVPQTGAIVPKHQKKVRRPPVILFYRQKSRCIILLLLKN